ncbi:MAG: sigma-54 dependent transcriptional regulator [Desulfobacterota bacterium]|nr:sigma-54 dependent transcriptional regulator [Thermodesulfobacteriota bacterium]
MISYCIYVLDDEETIREGITMALEKDYRVRTFSTAKAALEALPKDPPDLVLLDIGLPDMHGLEALRRIKALLPEALVIVVTAYEETDTVVSAMKLGASDYIVKPIYMEGLAITIRNAIDTIRLRKEVQVLQEKYLKENLPCFIGESNVIHDVMEFVEMVARSPDTPVLILGETGVGKELVASAIHYHSPNFMGPFIKVNCAAFPKELIESELFGYEKGAFTGASLSGKKGLIEEAANGTLFLDEVGDLSLESQAKLLRFLEAGEFYRIGGTKKLQVRVRVISATNKDLESLAERDQFRKDLYYRLGVIKIQIPSLSERREDIIPLAKFFLLRFNKKFGKSFTGFSPQAEKALMDHHWVGNVRELKNMVERAVLIGKGPTLTPKDLGIEKPPSGHLPDRLPLSKEVPSIPPEGIDLTALLQSLEKAYFEEALRIAEGNESKAARLLHLNHHTFRYRRKKLNIS